MQSQQPKLVLHFDINGTIMAFDSTENGTDEENANMIFAKNTYGKVINGQWVSNEAYDDTNDSVTYYNHLKNHSKNKNFKELCFIFTKEGQPGAKWVEYVEEVKKYMVLRLFNSFLHVLDEFPNALIVFRSFGNEIPEILHLLEHNPKFKAAHIFKADRDDDTNVFTMFKDSERIMCHNLTGMNMLYGMCDNAHLAIKENYHHWNNHGKHSTYGKSIQADEKLFQIFFDDNPCVHIIGDKNCHYVQVNTISALFDDGYFVNHIKKHIARKLK